MAARLLVAAMALLLLPACSGNDCEGIAPATLAQVQDKVFTPGCATALCHAGDRPSGNLSLEAGKSHAQSVGRNSTARPGTPVVTAKSLEESELWLQVQSGLMPQGAPPLDATQKALVQGWICAGAPAQ